MDLEQINKDVRQVTGELLEAAKLRKGMGLVIGGSTSEVIGEDLGSATNMKVAHNIIATIVEILKDNDVEPIIQACEHINRALVVERKFAEKYDLEPVNVVPIGSAGGGFATVAMDILEDPVVVEHVPARAGMDIGDVFIGMHIRGVGVVVRSEIKEIGKAHLTMIRTRDKLIGGDRSKHY